MDSPAKNNEHTYYYAITLAPSSYTSSYGDSYTYVYQNFNYGGQYKICCFILESRTPNYYDEHQVHEDS